MVSHMLNFIYIFWNRCLALTITTVTIFLILTILTFKIQISIKTKYIDFPSHIQKKLKTLNFNNINIDV